MQHPEVFACLELVLGVFGLLCLEVARRPAHGFATAAVVLTGKLVGPLGWAVAVLSGHWPVGSGMLILTNDVIW